MCRKRGKKTGRLEAKTKDFDDRLAAETKRRLDELQQKLEKEKDGYRAIPVFGKSGLMHTLTQADGYVMVEADQEGLRTGETVYVQLL